MTTTKSTSEAVGAKAEQAAASTSGEDDNGRRNELGVAKEAVDKKSEPGPASATAASRKPQVLLYG